MIDNILSKVESIFIKLLCNIDPEIAHNIVIFMLQKCFTFNKFRKYTNLENDVCGLHFQNPIGLAAGFDKNAQCLSNLSRYGFGFLEAGTVTINPQTGNVKPRIFRFNEDKSVINSCGFNNIAVIEFMKNVRKSRLNNGVLLGINIGKNKDSINYIEDYISLLANVSDHCDYVTINISSPNTEGLRSIQSSELLKNLLMSIKEFKDKHKTVGINRKIFLKIAPDLDNIELEEIARLIIETCVIDAIIISNTTISRDFDLPNNAKILKGGLSGRKIFHYTTERLEHFYRISEGKIPLIGSGGIDSIDTAYEKIRRGASLIQVYTGLIFNGFSLVNKINSGLSELLENEGYSNIRDVIGKDVKIVM